MVNEFIIKADDFLKNGFSRRWSFFLENLNRLGIPSSLGVVGTGVERWATGIRGLRDQLAIHELFAHGYDHFINKNGLSEYYGTSYDEQAESIRRTLLSAETKLGKTIISFGAPGNKTDDTTRKVLQDMQNIKIIFFQPPASNKIVLQRNMEFEYRIRFKNRTLAKSWYYLNMFLAKNGATSFDNSTYAGLKDRFSDVQKTKTILVAQMHPDWWSLRQQVELFLFLDELKSSNVVRFITPRHLIRNDS
jgi:peptidoglycan/xylan/chitin deacetylase (PgdA/CDA1 family)